MGLLEDAASSWRSLGDVQYYILLGRKKKWSGYLILTFTSESFAHLTGLHYADDVDLGVNKAELRGKKLIKLIETGKITTETVEKSEHYLRIQKRLEGILLLENTLDSDFQIFMYDPQKVPHGTLIDANYVIKNTRSGVTFFVFIEEDSGVGFCKSIFSMVQADYSINQSRLTVLKKEKRRSGQTEYTYINPNYVESI